MKGGLTSDVIGTVLYYAMKASDPALTLDAVKEMVDMQNMPEVTAAIIEASGMQPVDSETVAEVAKETGEPEQADPPVPTLVTEAPSVEENLRSRPPAVVVGAPPSED